MSDIILPLPFYSQTPSTCPSPMSLGMLHNIHSQKVMRGDSIYLKWYVLQVCYKLKNWSNQKLGKSAFCTLHLQRSLTRWSVTMMMQARCQIKADELSLILVHILQE